MRSAKGDAYVDRWMQCGELGVEGVENFKYLGVVVPADEEMCLDIEARIALGTKCAPALIIILTSRWN